MNEDHLRIRDFVLRYFELIGARMEEPEPGVLRVELTREWAKELDGDSVAGWMWMQPSQQPAQITYYFTFSPEVAQRNEEVELIGPGSLRLQQVVESVRRLAKGTRMWLPHPPIPRFEKDLGDGTDVSARSVVYRPFYLFTFRLDVYGAWVKPARLIHLAVDRTDQLVLRQLAEVISRLPMSPGRPPNSTFHFEEATIDFDDAFLLAYQELILILQIEPAHWAAEAHTYLREERNRLENFYAERARDEQGADDELRRRLEELDMMRPKVIVRPQGVTDLYLPVTFEDGSVRHLAFESTSDVLTPSAPVR